MVKVQLLLVNAVMMVDLWVTSVASGSTSISKQSIAYTEKCDKCVHGGGICGDIRDLWDPFSIAKVQLLPANAVGAAGVCHGGAIVGIIRELWKHFNIDIVQRMPNSQS